MSQLERRAPWEERQVERAHSGARGMGAYLPNRLCNFAGFVIALRGPILLVRGVVVGGIEVSMLARESVRPLSLAALTLLPAHSVRDSVAGPGTPTLLYNGPGTPTPSQQWEGASGRFGTISNVVEEESRGNTLRLVSQRHRRGGKM